MAGKEVAQAGASLLSSSPRILPRAFCSPDASLDPPSRFLQSDACLSD